MATQALLVCAVLGQAAQPRTQREPHEQAVLTVKARPIMHLVINIVQQPTG